MKYETYSNEFGSIMVKKTTENGAEFYIPPDPINTDYQEYLAWLAEGNTPELWNPEEQ